MEGGLWATGDRGRVSCDDVDVLAATVGGFGFPDRIFEAVKSVVAATGALTGKTRRALDSTVLDDAVATQDTVTQLIAAIRRVRREVPGAAEVIAEHCSAHDYDDPGKPAIAWDDSQARDRLVDALVSDAHRLLGEPGAVEVDGHRHRRLKVGLGGLLVDAGVLQRGAQCAPSCTQAFLNMRKPQGFWC